MEREPPKWTRTTTGRALNLVHAREYVRRRPERPNCALPRTHRTHLAQRVLPRCCHVQWPSSHAGSGSRTRADRSPRIAAIGDTAVTNGGQADGFPVVGELIDGLVGADSQRLEASELRREADSQQSVRALAAPGLLQLRRSRATRARVAPYARVAPGRLGPPASLRRASPPARDADRRGRPFRRVRARRGRHGPLGFA